MIKKRQEIYDLYFKFACERQKIFFKKFEGYSKTYTKDPILKEYKFCNAYRASDRVSQYLISSVIYTEQKYNYADIIFRIIFFKIFNKVQTWQYLTERLGQVSLSNFNFKDYSMLLDEYIKKGNKLYNSAYISCANKTYGYNLKYQNHLALIQDMIKDNLAEKIVSAKKYSEVFETLKSYPLIGNFMSYQLMTDINYSDIINFDENDFTIAGPGAIRGINKCFEDKSSMPYDYFIMYMVQNQESEFKRLGLKFRTLYGRKLHAIDCQNIFCELDKYCRVAYPGLKSNRKKIKTKYSPTTNKINYFYPPKWHINQKIPYYIV